MKLINNFTLFVLGMMLCLSFHDTVAQEKKSLRYPYGCFPIGYHFEYFNLILTPTAKVYPQAVYFIHNISNRSVNLFQTRTGKEPYTVHINSTIQARYWSVLASDEKKSKYICTNDAKNLVGHDVINCSKVLDICEYPYVRFGDNHHGNYWALENVSTSVTESAVSAEHFGLLLIDPKQQAKVDKAKSKDE